MKPLLLVALAVLLPCSAGAQVFKCVDANGKTTFSDQGCATGHAGSAISVAPANSSDGSQYRNQAPAYSQPETVQRPSGPRVTVVGGNSDLERERKRLCKEASTPHKGAPGLTASQLAASAKLCAGVDVPMPEPAAAQPYTAPAPAAPPVITSCDAAGCWDSNGVRYNQGAGTTMIPSTGGPACQLISGQMICP